MTPDEHVPLKRLVMKNDPSGKALVVSSLCSCGKALIEYPFTIEMLVPLDRLRNEVETFATLLNAGRGCGVEWYVTQEERIGFLEKIKLALDVLRLDRLPSDPRKWKREDALDHVHRGSAAAYRKKR